MNHKIDPKFNNPNNPSSDNSENASNQAQESNISAHKLPQNSFKDFLKSKVHRPHVSAEFIQQIKKTIPRD